MLNDKQMKCIELMVEGHMTQKQISEEINVSEKTICEWKRNVPEFMEEHDKLFRNSFKKVAPKARKKLETLLQAESEQVQLSAAKELLNYAGYKAVEKHEIEAHNTSYNDATSAELELRIQAEIDKEVQKRIEKK